MDILSVKAVDGPRQREIRRHFSGLTKQKRSALLDDVLSSGDHETVNAIGDAQAYLSGMTRQEVSDLQKRAVDSLSWQRFGSDR
ncbi:MAG: hypothetical protein ABFS45_23225 [Pseudomonadota bacterium]